ncbi:hypothetical protein L1049_004367 [Liquidambar formosana]|uniref:Uncharacterized protein n=1 Tax=Liquidambar formosana TaxID=63359 RepID=A0AAP0RSS2_LIQFO
MGTNGETSNPDQKKQECCIYKVHNGLRKANPGAYTPMLVSIGPYHKKDSNLMAMQDCKTQYKTTLLGQRDVKEDTCKSELKKLKLLVRARECYADLIKLEDEDFVEMMMLDGCFIIGFLREINPNDSYNPGIINVDWMKSQICRDLMLLENQLPYFVLDKLYKMTIRPDEQKRSSLWETVMLAFNFMLPKPRSLRFISDCQVSTDKIKHLLHLVHIFCRYPLGDEITANRVCEQTRQSEPGLPITPRRNLDQLRQPFLREQSTEITENGTGVQVLNRMGSVVELREAGVTFKKIGEVYNFVDLTKRDESHPDDVSLFEIEFKGCGLMTVPSFKIEGSTESLFRNLIAYEQHSSENNQKYFTDFTTLMDQLINSGKDVEFLRRNGIIVNLLGDDKTVSDLFNTLNEGVIESHESNYAYSRLRQKVNIHCAKKVNTFRALLMRDYLSTPCVAASTFAAILLLALAIIQTVLAFITLFE